MTVTATTIIIIIIQYTIFYIYLLDMTFTLLIKTVRKKVLRVLDSEKKGCNTKNAIQIYSSKENGLNGKLTKIKRVTISIPS